MNWKMIFALSKVNGGTYLGDLLPHQIWQWPSKTWLQERLRDVRTREKQWLMEHRMTEENLEVALQAGSIEVYPRSDSSNFQEMGSF